jgi:phosphatidate cytidylyltransferase
MSDVKKATLTRILSAVVALPVYLYCLYADQPYFIPIFVVSLLITLVCLHEYYQISYRDEEQRPYVAFGFAAGFAVNILMYFYAFGGLRYFRGFDVRAFFLVLTLFTAAVLVYQVFRRPLKGGIYSLAVTVFGVIYIVLFFSHIILIKALNHGFYYLMILNVVVMINDSAAYFGGVLFGKHKTGFPASPNKSWEGYFSGLLFSVLAMVITNHIFIAFYNVVLFSMIEAVLLGIALSVLGHVGDLVESAVKRDGAIKDSGSIIPGHGGMWDVFDALIFTMPVFYYYLVIRSAL